MPEGPSYPSSALLLSFDSGGVASEPQEAPDASKVYLLSAQSAQLIEKDGQSYRKVVGPAKFLHNNTYLLCDTALWNVNTNVIDAMGNVRIIQDQTRSSSSTLQYVVDDNMAKFRGDLVQLEDKDRNTLRTRYLDYNTKDSVAIFQDGAAMRDKDGQVIESLYGTYDSKAHLFVFNDQVNMYLDTTFVKTSRLEYRSDLSTAYFGYGTDMWQDDKMLSANDGWYDRPGSCSSSAARYTPSPTTRKSGATPSTIPRAAKTWSCWGTWKSWTPPATSSAWPERWNTRTPSPKSG